MGETVETLRTRLRAESSDGLKLLKSLQQNPICSVSIDDSVPCIQIVWKRYATSTQLRFVHESLIQMLKEHGVVKILGDDTALPTIHADDQRWIVENWMPRAKAAGLLAAASKRPTAYFGKLAVEAVQSVAPAGLHMASFEDIVAARDWLRNCATK
jgi:hypothetical protein